MYLNQPIYPPYFQNQLHITKYNNTNSWSKPQRVSLNFFYVLVIIFFFKKIRTEQDIASERDREKAREIYSSERQALTRDVACDRPDEEAELHCCLKVGSFDHWFLRFLWAAGLHSLASDGASGKGVELGLL